MPKRNLPQGQDIAELVDALLVVAVNKSYPARSAYDAARFAWRVSAAKVAKLDYVLAAKDRQIVGVFVAEEWKPVTKAHFPEFGIDWKGRRAFTGREADEEAKARYLGRYLPPGFKFNGTGLRYAGKAAE